MKKFTMRYDIVAAILILSALDGLLTMFWIETGQAVEANPIMALLININMIWFFFGKILMTYIFVAALELIGAYKVNYFVLGIYIIIIIYHLLFGFLL